VKGVVLRPEDDLNLAVYNRTAKELLGDQASGSAGAESDLKAFPQAVGRYTGGASDAQ
jgi:hypothetical protein